MFFPLRGLHGVEEATDQNRLIGMERSDAHHRQQERQAERQTEPPEIVRDIHSPRVRNSWHVRGYTARSQGSHSRGKRGDMREEGEGKKQRDAAAPMTSGASALRCSGSITAACPKGIVAACVQSGLMGGKGPQGQSERNLKPRRKSKIRSSTPDRSHWPCGW